MLPNSGLISLNDVRKELNIVDNVVSLNHTAVRQLAEKPYGLIQMSDLYGKSAGLNPMNCDYYFDSIEDFKNRIEGIVIENNSFLNTKSFGFNPKLTHLSLATYLSKTEIQSTPRIIVSKASTINLFQNCKKLKIISETLFDGCTEVENLRYCFSYCNSVLELPAKLFFNLLKLKNIGYIFQNCEKIKKIPVAFLDNCKKIENLEYAFARCINLMNIPYNLFDQIEILYDTHSCFQGDYQIIDNLPPVWELFPYSNHQHYGKECTNAPNYSSMPDSCK